MERLKARVEMLRRAQAKINFKGGGQECPPHTKAAVLVRDRVTAGFPAGRAVVKAVAA